MGNNEPWTMFEPKRENILSMLHAVQAGEASTTHIPTEKLAAVAKYVGIPPAELEGIASFYRAYARRPRGRHIIRLCDSLSCRIRGAVDVYRYVVERLGIQNGETTSDGLFSLEVVNCLGSCDTAPNLMIDGTLIPDATPERVERALLTFGAAERGLEVHR